MPNITAGVVSDVGAVANAVGQVANTAGKVVDANQAAQDKQAGAALATSQGQAAVLKEIDLAKRIDVAAQSTAANDPDTPDGGWFSWLRRRFRRADK